MKFSFSDVECDEVCHFLAACLEPFGHVLCLAHFSPRVELRGFCRSLLCEPGKCGCARQAACWREEDRAMTFVWASVNSGCPGRMRRNSSYSIVSLSHRSRGTTVVCFDFVVFDYSVKCTESRKMFVDALSNHARAFCAELLVGVSRARFLDC